MASQSRQSKVLRIGIIQDGKIVQERLIKSGGSVTVGESAKNTFVFPKTHLNRAEFTLFKSAGRGYVLQFTDKMRGRISSGGAVVALHKLINDSSVSKADGCAQLPLTEQDRGKISIDNVTVLFQFVAPPPVTAVKAIQQMDFRPRMLEEDDPVFLGFLAIWSALAMVLVLWVWATEPRDFTLEEVPDRFARIVQPDTVPVEDLTLDIESDEGEAVEKEVEKEEKDTKESKSKESAEVQDARAKEDLKDEVLQQSKLLLKIIGTTGESNSMVENLWSDEDQGLGDIDSALAETSGVALSAADAGPRTGNAGGNDRADIGDLGGVGGGKAGSVAGPAVKVKPRVTAGSGSLDGSGDASAVKSTVSRFAGQLKYCYEKRLKAVPSLEGRVEVGWSVVGGGVDGSPYVVVNTTGDADLADCITRKIRRWTFPADVEGDLSWPFVFQQKK